VCEVVGVTGAFLVGGANEAVAVIFVKTLGMFYGDDAQQMREGVCGCVFVRFVRLCACALFEGGEGREGGKEGGAVL
jgi:hypothetical protein